MKRHQWQYHEFGPGGCVKVWHCPGCLTNHRVESADAQPPAGWCRGKPRHTAEEAALVAAAYDRLGWELPGDFWETAGGRALQTVLAQMTAAEEARH